MISEKLACELNVNKMILVTIECNAFSINGVEISGNREK